MSLYWYSLQNLNMGRFVLRATGNGGFRLGGAAVYSFKRRHSLPSTTVEQCTPDIGSLFSKYGEYLRTLARINATTPAADPPDGEILAVVYDTQWDKYRDALAKTKRTLNRLDATIAAPTPTQGIILVEDDQDPPALTLDVPDKTLPPAGVIEVRRRKGGNESLSAALERAKRKIEKLRLAEATVVITEES